MNFKSEKFKKLIEYKSGYTWTKEQELDKPEPNSVRVLTVTNIQEKLDLSNELYLKDVNEVQINDYEPDPSDMTPYNMFNIYQKDFYYIKTADENVLDKPCNVIDLSPKDKSRSYFKVRIWINKQTNLLSRIKIFDKNGYRYTYTINSININSKIEDSEFNFDKNKYPGVHIEDLRF